MRANTDRSRRLAFDSVAGRYDAARPRFAGAVIDTLLERAGLAAGDRVVEVGAGTGQLTGALLDAGLSVVALEPGRRMAAMLRATFARRQTLEVVGSLFEEFTPATASFDAVVSANAFHWVDPAVGYDRAADLLGPAGRLALLWSFPVLADPEVQRGLNVEAFVDDLSDLAREPEGYLDVVTDNLRGRHEEMAASGRFDPPWWEVTSDMLHWDVDGYVRFLSSLASTVDRHEEIGRRVTPMVGRDHPLRVINYQYLGVARRR